MTQDTQIVKRPDRTPLSQRDPIAIAKHFFQSGYFSDTKSMSQAVVKIVAGEELGLGPMAAMNGFHIIEGKPAPSANILATLIKRSDKYDYKLLEAGPEKVSIAFFEDGVEQGIVTCRPEDFKDVKAKERGQFIPLLETARWRGYPEDMLFARCISRGRRRYCPEVTSGNPAYTPDELGVEMTASGEVIEVEVASADVESEQVTDAVPELDTDRFDFIRKAFDLAGPPLQEIQLMLGACGVDSIDSMDDLEDRLRFLTGEQFDRLSMEVSGFADRSAEPEADADETIDAETGEVTADVA